MFLPFQYEEYKDEYYGKRIYYEDYVGVYDVTQYDFQPGMESWHGYKYYNTDKNNNPIGELLTYGDSPAYKNHAWTVDVTDINIQQSTGRPTITGELGYHYMYFVPKGYITSDHMGRGISTIDEGLLTLTINDDQQFTIKDPDDGWARDGEVIDFEIKPNVNVFQDGLTIDWNISSHYGFNKNGIINTLFKNDGTFDVDLTNEDEQKVMIPVNYSNNKYYYEHFTFRKNELLSKYPKKISDIVQIEYRNDYENIIPEFKVTNNMFIDGLEGTETNHKVKIENNVVSFDEYYHYDNIQKKTINGFSSKYESSKEFILPWDYRNNKGIIDLNLNSTTYSNFNFNINILMGSDRSLRGHLDSKYIWKTTQYKKMVPKFSLFIPDVTNVEITKENILEWLND